jgi:gliding motility-associated-like protein
LVAGKKYCVQFYVSLADTCGYATDLIGAYFSNDSLLSNTLYNFNVTPQVQNQQGNVITDKQNWILISGSFIAQGGERFITIGNFANDANTDIDTIQSVPPYFGDAFYYIDNVSVYCCDADSCTTDSELQIANVFTPNGDGINDVFNIKNKNLAIIDCKIYNRWGSIVYNITAPNDFWDGHTTSGEPCSNGLYYYILTATGTDGKEYLRNGYVQLVR